MSQVSVAMIISGLVVWSKFDQAPFLPIIDWQLTLIILSGLLFAVFGLNFVGEEVWTGFMSCSSGSESILVLSDVLRSLSS